MNKEKEILKLANHFMKPLVKYGDAKRGYNFSKVKSPKRKSEIISILIGEIIYEVVKYKDVKALKSLTECIFTEIEELIRQ